MMINLIVIIIITNTQLILYNFTLVIILIIVIKQQIQLILHNFLLININHYYNNNIQN